MSSSGKKRSQETENGHSVTTKPRKKRTKIVPRISETGPPIDPATELRMIRQVVERHLFPAVKFINGNVELDKIGKGGICRFMSQKLHIMFKTNIERQEWWTRIKGVVKAKINQCRTDATSSMRKKYSGTEIMFYWCVAVCLDMLLTSESCVFIQTFAARVRKLMSTRS
jgi:hypothetical protein